MLTPITSLKEIVSMVPDTPRKFQINKDELMGIDQTKAIAARTFIGVLIKSDDDIVTNGETCKFVEVFYEGGINITALLSDELKKLLFKDTSNELDDDNKMEDIDTFNLFSKLEKELKLAITKDDCHSDLRQH